MIHTTQRIQIVSRLIIGTYFKVKVLARKRNLVITSQPSQTSTNFSAFFIISSPESQFKCEFESIISQGIDDMFTMRFSPYDPDYIAVGTELGMVYIYHVPTGHFIPGDGIDTTMLSQGGKMKKTPVTAVR